MRFIGRRMKGQSTVELAIAFPVLALLLVVVGDFARVFYTAIEVANAARAGVQYGAQSYATAIETDKIKQAVLNDGANLSGLSATTSNICMCGGQVVACSPPQCSQPQTYVKVTATATFTPILKFPGLPTSVPLSSTAIMEVQQ
jgi:Flp pilus assembly protein TadG